MPLVTAPRSVAHSLARLATDFLGEPIEERAVVEPLEAHAGEHLLAVPLLAGKIEQQPKLGLRAEVTDEIGPIAGEQPSQLLPIERAVAVGVVPGEEPPDR